ncbi:MAG: TolB family protein [Solirubrobacterales bacterium]
MSRDALGEALYGLQIPASDGAEERGRQIVEAAYAERRSEGSDLRGAAAPTTSDRRSRRPLPRLALALGMATLLAALLLSPAGAAVRDWVDEAISNGAPPPEPTLSRVPGGGSLLVQTGEGPVVVEPDGTRRLLGDYETASWSPHGLFVVAAKGRTLSALEPDGTPRWSLTAARRVGFPGGLMAAPSWSPSGERIAYRSGFDLRVVAGDGTEDRLLARSIAAGTPPGAAVAPAFSPVWSPTGKDELAYVTGTGRLQILDSETGDVLAGAPGLQRINWVDWADGGRKILEASRGTLRLRPVLRAGHPSRPALGKPHLLPRPSGAAVNDAALAPQRPIVAASVTYWRKHGTYSEVIVYRPGKKPRTLLSVPGSLWQVEWSPDGKRLLVAWPGANQWLFLPLGRGRGKAIANISRAIAPSGRPTSFPLLEGWCCRR